MVDACVFIGWYTLIASKKVDAEGKVLAIEPHPRNFSILLRNIRDNDLKNVIPLNIALSDRDGYGWLAILPSPAQHSIMFSLDHRIPVKMKKMDAMLEELNINQVDLFKIDVEGAELKVLKGSENILKKRNKINYRDFSTCRN